MTPGKLHGIRRLADATGRFTMLAVDQRPPIKNPIAKALGTEVAPWAEVAKFKQLLVTTLQAHCSAALLDPHYAIPAAFTQLLPTNGLIVTLEDSVFTESIEGRLSSCIDDWSVAKIKKMSADAVKVLVWYRPDAATQVLTAQQDFVKEIGAQCYEHDIPFLLEMLVYPFAANDATRADYTEMPEKVAEHVLQSVAEFAKEDYGVDIFKLESPLPPAQIANSANAAELFVEMGNLAKRPWVMLSAGANQANFLSILELAYQAGAAGFLAGRAIWQNALAQYPDWQQIEQQLTSNSLPYLQQLNALTAKQATPWYQHNCYGEAGPQLNDASANFRHNY